jgi:hypothetical protein
VTAATLIVCLSLIPTDLSLIYFQPVFIIWFNAESILLLLRQDPEVAHLAAVYLKWSSFGLPAYSFNYISRCDSIHTISIFIPDFLRITAVIFNLKVMNVTPLEGSHTNCRLLLLRIVRCAN